MRRYYGVSYNAEDEYTFYSFTSTRERDEWVEAGRWREAAPSWLIPKGTINEVWARMPTLQRERLLTHGPPRHNDTGHTHFD